MQIVSRRIIKPTDTELEQLKNIYEANFPASERKPFQMLVDGIEDQSYICMVGSSQDDPANIAAIAFLMPLPGVTTIFLEYIAVSAMYQGQGIGSQMFGLMVDYFKAENIADALIWEVEPSESDDPNHATNKRIRFYEKLGARIIALSEVYAMPNFEDLATGFVSLRLMQVPISEQPDKATVHGVIKSIYDTAYPNHMTLRDSILNHLSHL